MWAEQLLCLSTSSVTLKTKSQYLEKNPCTKTQENFKLEISAGTPATWWQGMFDVLLFK